MKKYICIHGHFYQPPRENPWLEAIEQQETALPYHDWNERICAECYAPNTAARIVNERKKIIDIINNYSKISFNFGPTLFSWMECSEPQIYEAILKADRTNRQASSHGAAIAQCYSHMIMPLANSRDKKTQVLWGIRDFEQRFERKPEGMWLPETAVDIKSLELMAENGIQFTILSPYQAKNVKKLSENDWTEVTGGRINPQLPYICKLPSGKQIVIFFYDGNVSHDVAFGDLLANGNNLANRLLGCFPEQASTDVLVHIAVDGETFGHHHKFGDMALAYFLRRIETDSDAEIITYGAFLNKVKPEYEVEVIENSSWSCSHGVGRWSYDCSCALDPNSGWNQKWREFLRNALDWLRDEMAIHYENEIKKWTDDPWLVRDHYVDVILDRSEENVERFFKEYIKGSLSYEDRTQILKLLELQRYAMAMYTSCGWFFDDISRIESVQIMLYAARAIQLAKDLFSIELERPFLDLLEQAKSNLKEYKDGKVIFNKIVKPRILDLKKVTVHYAILSLFEKPIARSKIYCYTVLSNDHQVFHSEDKIISFGSAKIFSNITWEIYEVNFVSLYYEEEKVMIGIEEISSKKKFSKIEKALKNSFLEKDYKKTRDLIEEFYQSHDFTLWDLFQDEKRKILKKVLKNTLEKITSSLEDIHVLHYSIIKTIREKKLPVPQVLLKSLDLSLNTKLLEMLEKKEANLTKLSKIVKEIQSWKFLIDINSVSYHALKQLETLMTELSEDPLNIPILKKILRFLEIMSALPLNWNLWRVQNVYFSLYKAVYQSKEKKLSNEEMLTWKNMFKKLGEILSFKII